MATLLPLHQLKPSWYHPTPPMPSLQAHRPTFTAAVSVLQADGRWRQVCPFIRTTGASLTRKVRQINEIERGETGQCPYMASWASYQHAIMGSSSQLPSRTSIGSHCGSVEACGSTAALQAFTRIAGGDAGADYIDRQESVFE